MPTRTETTTPADPAANGEAHPPIVLTPQMLDLKWALEQRDQGAFMRYWGKKVAVYERRVVGSGKNGLKLMERVARKLGIDPVRLAVVYVGPWQ